MIQLLSPLLLSGLVCLFKVLNVFGASADWDKCLNFSGGILYPNSNYDASCTRDTEIFADGVSISELKPGCFDHMTSLSKLGLWNNKFPRIDKGVMDNVPNLRELKIHNNPNLKYIAINAFGTTELTFVWLPRVLHKLPMGLFDHAPMVTVQIWENGTHAQYNQTDFYATKYFGCSGNPCDTGICTTAQGIDPATGYYICCDSDSGDYFGGTCQYRCSDCNVQGHTNCTKELGCVCKTGWNGVLCEKDIDECNLDIDKCSSDATCANIDGGYTCTCNAGFVPSNSGEICNLMPCNFNTFSAFYLDKTTLRRRRGDSYDKINTCLILDVSNKGIEYIEDGLFDDFQALTELNLKQNDITRLPLGMIDHLQPLIDSLDTKLLMELSTKCSIFLYTLDSQNTLRRKVNPVFSYARTCVYLDLSNYSISALDTDSFQAMTSVKHLDLRFNNLTTIPPNVFDPMNVGLSENSLLLDEKTKCSSYGFEVDDNGVIERKTSPEFDYLSHCTTLVLDTMNIQQIPELFFVDFSTLNTIALNENKISNILSFYNLASLRNLNLDNNNISTLDSNVIESLVTSSTAISINNNPLDCCVEAPQIGRIIATQITTNVNCEMSNYGIMNINSSIASTFTYNCTSTKAYIQSDSTNNNTIIIAVCSCVGFLLVIIFIVLVVFVFRKKKKNNFLAGTSAIDFVLGRSDDQISEFSKTYTPASDPAYANVASSLEASKEGRDDYDYAKSSDIKDDQYENNCVIEEKQEGQYYSTEEYANENFDKDGGYALVDDVGNGLVNNENQRNFEFNDLGEYVNITNGLVNENERNYKFNDLGEYANV